MAESFEITVDPTYPNATVVRVRGRVDGRTAPELMAKSLAAHANDRPLVLNLADVTFMSSAGVGVLMVLAEKLGGDRGKLRLAPVSDAVRSVLALLNLDRFLAIDASEVEAVKAIGA